MSLLINALGITDSGGIRVLEKCLDELSNESRETIICYNPTLLMNSCIDNYMHKLHFKFIPFPKKNFLHRLWIENWIFRLLVQHHAITLIYNFSGTAQFFLRVPQLIKLHNLMFYSKELDHVYFRKNKYIKWLLQIGLKRTILLLMYHKQEFFEIQSTHVQDYFLQFISSRHIKFFLKSDIDYSNIAIPKSYNFSKKLRFLYIVGPHFEIEHKNFADFVQAMHLLSEIRTDFEICITLTKEQLSKSSLWEDSLFIRTKCIGYVSKEKILNEFCDNTLLISTSIIETLGLHVIEAIKGGIIPIVPNVGYAQCVYSEQVKTYTLFEPRSLIDTIYEISQWTPQECFNHLLELQYHIGFNEARKHYKITEIFEKILKGT